MRASSASGGSALLQFSHVGLSSSIAASAGSYATSFSILAKGLSRSQVFTFSSSTTADVKALKAQRK